MFSLLLGALAAIYVVVLGWAAMGLRRALGQAVSSAGDFPTVSVVVAARDERDGIEACIESILASDYPAAKLQLVIVDDGSTDGTTDILDRMRQAASSEPELVVVRTARESAGKAEAIELGIAASKGEIVVTTDADCRVGARWLHALISKFDADVGFVAGPVVFDHGSTVIEHLQALEFLSLVGFGAGMIGNGAPTICNSANAAYRRVLHDRWKCGNKASMVAASDELIMHYVHSQTSYRVVFCSDLGAIVETAGTESLSQFWNQRTRWASSVPQFPAHVTALGTVIFSFYFYVVVGFLMAVVMPGLLLAAGLAACAKLVVDSLVVVPICRHVRRQYLLKYFMLAEIFHIPYILAAVPYGVFGQVRWKDRRIGANPPTGHDSGTHVSVAHE